MSLDEIIQMPRVMCNMHESTFRCYHILERVLEMVQKGDTADTIIEIATFLKYHDGKKEGKEQQESARAESQDKDSLE